MNFFGLLLGLASLFIIGLGFPLVIQAERHLGYLWWPYMMGLGFLLVAASLFIPNDWLSALVGVVGTTFTWGSVELSTQAVRAKLGWFPFKEKKIQPPFADVIRKWQAPHL